MKNFSKLVPKIITDRNGHRKKVYVKVGDDKDLKKRSKTLKLMSSYRSIVGKLNKAMTEKDGNSVKALAVKLMVNHGIRIGNEKSAAGYKAHATGEQTQTFGLTTLNKSHVKKIGNAYQLNFTGKRGVAQSIKVTHEEDVKALDWLIGMTKGDNNVLFPYSNYDITKYIKENIGDYSPKDFRTLRANIEASKLSTEISKRPLPKTKTELNAEINEISEKVSKVLGNTKGVAKRSYIDDFILNAHITKRWVGKK